MTVPRIKHVKPSLDGKKVLYVTFDNDETKEFDVHPYILDIPAFAPLKNDVLFRQVKVDVGGFGLIWNQQIDLDRYDVWEFGKTVNVAI